MIAVIILLRDLATQRMSWSDGSYRLEVLSFSIKIAVLTFLVKKYIEAFWGVNFFYEKFKLNLILVVVRKSCPS